MSKLATLQQTVLAARSRPNGANVGTQISKDRVDVVRAVPPASGRGRYAVTILCGGLSLSEAIAYVAAL